ncbi:MAG: ribbon-helix-helix protein, CopG family [Thermoplasmata archaeon]|jgi:Arc/MetJ-type ribon-helix-helix transcriptional regulator
MSDNEKDEYRITVRLDKDLYMALNKLVSEGGVKSISELVRNALIEYIEEHLKTENKNYIIKKIRLTKIELEKIKEIVESGEFIDEQEVIRNAIRKYLESLDENKK